MSTETLSEPREADAAERLEPQEIREMQLRASVLQLRISELGEEERTEYRGIMATLRDNEADDWGD